MQPVRELIQRGLFLHAVRKRLLGALAFGDLSHERILLEPQRVLTIGDNRHAPPEKCTQQGDEDDDEQGKPHAEVEELGTLSSQPQPAENDWQADDERQSTSRQSTG